jgi:DNA-binding response OmpR family regulator
MAELRPGLPDQLRVLVVDGEAEARVRLEHQLSRLGCATLTAPAAAEARACLAANDVHLLLCALHLPDETGLDLLRWLRQTQTAPCDVIVFTPTPTVDSAIQALRLGAADYLTQPISEATLAAALERIGQRRARAALPDTAELRPPPAAQQYHIGPVLLDLDRFVVAVNGRPVEATPSELEILHYLCRHPDRVVTAQELVQSLRGYAIDPRQAPEILRPHISNLRRKLLAAATEADVVRTVRGVGYMLRAPKLS